MTEPFPPGARVAGYARDSGGRTQELSTDQQTQAIAEYCQEHGLVLSRMFVDEARSGGSANRAAFLEMVDYLPGAPESGVILWSYSRFSRQYDDNAYYLATIRRAGKIVHSLLDPVPDNLEGRLIESIHAYQSAKVRENMGRDIRRGHRYIAERYNAMPYGEAPIGYRLVEIDGVQHRDGSHRRISRLELDPETAPIVRHAYELRAAGATFHEILAAHPDIGALTTTVSRILHNPIYTGRLVTRSYEVDDFCPPLIDPDTWEAAQQVNQARAGRYAANAPRSVRSPHLLSGLVRCASCGHVMTINRGGARSKRLYYHCNGQSYSERCYAPYIRVDRLDAIVLDLVRGLASDETLITDIRAEAERLRANTAPDDSEQQRARIQAQIARLLSAIRDAGHSPALLAELERLETQERAIQPRPPRRPAPDLDNLVERIRSQIDADPRAAVRGLVLEVRAAAAPRGGPIHGLVVVQIADQARNLPF